MKILLGVLCVILSFSSTFSNDAPKKIAIVDFLANGADSVECKIITEYFRSSFSKLKEYSVYERSNMAEILKEQGLQQSGICSETECAIKIGKLLSVPRIVVGSLSKLENSYTLSARMVNVESGVIEREVKPRTVRGKLEKLIPEIDPMVLEISNTVGPKNKKGKIVALTAGISAVVATAVIIPIIILKKDSDNDNTTSSKVIIKW